MKSKWCLSNTEMLLLDSEVSCCWLGMLANAAASGGVGKISLVADHVLPAIQAVGSIYTWAASSVHAWGLIYAPH